MAVCCPCRFVQHGTDDDVLFVGRQVNNNGLLLGDTGKGVDARVLEFANNVDTMLFKAAYHFGISRTLTAASACSGWPLPARRLRHLQLCPGFGVTCSCFGFSACPVSAPAAVSGSSVRLASCFNAGCSAAADEVCVIESEASLL